MILKLKKINELTEQERENLYIIEDEGLDYALDNGYINPEDYIVDEESKKKYSEADTIVYELKNHLQELFCLLQK